MVKKVDQVIQVGGEILRKKALLVPKIGVQEKAIINRMKEILMETHGIGLAAPQIGENKQIVLVGTPDKDLQKELKLGFFVLVNPKIVDQSEDEEIMEEGCLSFMKPEMRGEVSRPLYVKVEAHDKKGQPIELEAFDLLARSIFHEIDHLKGILFVDKADPATIYEHKLHDEKESVIG